ncbi:MAG TPA: toll/interleukin-1 receptor domain-containing protein [Ktedonobacteraceae bacterium]|nr:toll/interleukin-1 receptor domain-containing protein [Ktedonobacteraceae bacterium]
MADPELVKIVQQESEVWNSWREQHPETLHIDLSNSDLSSAHLSKANLNKVNLSKTVLIDTDLTGADLTGADLTDADLTGADLTKADLIETILRGSDLTRTILKEANLSKALLVNANLSDVDLRGATLIDADLSKANLDNVDLTEADLRYTDLSYANLTGSDLTGTILTEADLTGTMLINTMLIEADLTGVTLEDAILRDTILSHANLREALVGNTIFVRVDLREVKGLAEIHHWGPSCVELYTVQFPQDGSALHFLRGAGVPDEWIDDYRARMIHPIQYHSCFISYAHQDDDLARRLHADLQEEGVRCWFAPHDMKIGDKIRPRIDEAIHLQDKFLLILSKHSVASDWVEHEVEMALARERKEKRTILFPIRLDNAILEQEYIGWPALVQHERHIGDFTEWKDHDQYQVAFKRLLRDLKQADA